MFKIYNTMGWDYSQIALYRKDITTAIYKLRDEFAHDINLFEIASKIAQGQLLLWLILDEQAKFKAVLLTEIEQKQDYKRLNLCHLAGVGGQALVDVLPQLEEYALEHNVDEICPIGRTGWQRALRNYGYKPMIFKYSKKLKENNNDK